MAEGRLVLTDVDRLVEYLEEKRVVSLEQASKDLNLPLKTVESLASLLEEEQIFHTTYKFTTPYLNFGPPPEKKGAKKKGEPKKEGRITVTKEEGEKEKAAPLELSTTVRPAKPLVPARHEVSELKEGAAPPEAPGAGAAAERKARADIETLVQRAMKLIEEGDVEGARAIFFEIKRKREGLSKEYLEKERKLKDSIARLNEYFIMGSDKAIRSKFDEKYEHISALLDSAERLAKKGIDTHEDLDRADEIYHQVKHEYLALPEGFIEKRIALQDRLLELYKAIILSKKKILSAEFDKRSQKILDLMQKTADAINQNDFDSAHQTFDAINAIYRELPEGFLKEKTELQNKILDVYQTLIMSDKKRSENKIEAEAQFIAHKIDECRRMVEERRFADARKTYEEVTSHYAQLPEGFIATKANLESDIVDLHHIISMQLNKRALADMEEKLKRIDRIMDSCEKACKRPEYDLAQQMYLEAVQLYNSIPRGYSELIPYQRRLFAAYKELLPHVAALPKKRAGKDVQGRHQMILQILARIQGLIDAGEFAKIKSAYLQAHEIYSSLPVSFVDKESGLHAQMVRVYEEATLLLFIDKLEEAAAQENKHVMRDILDKIKYLLDKVAPKYSQDRALFDHVNKKLLIYKTLLDEGLARGPQNGEEVKQRMEEYAKGMGTLQDLPEIEEGAPLADEGALEEIQAEEPLHPIDEGTQEWGGIEQIGEEMPPLEDAAGNQPQNLHGEPLPVPPKEKEGIFSRLFKGHKKEP